MEATMFGALNEQDIELLRIRAACFLPTDDIKETEKDEDEERLCWWWRWWWRWRCLWNHVVHQELSNRAAETLC